MKHQSSIVVNLGSIFVQTQDAGSSSFEDDKRKCSASVLSGIIEVLVNAIATELGKASDRNKLDLERELIQFVELYHSLDKDTSFSRQSTATRRGNTRTPAHDKLNNMNSCHSKEMQGRISFFATSSIYQLLQMVLRLLDTDYFNNAEASQKHSQSNSKTSKCSSEFISFLLNVSP
ncbi:hypothetical protein M0R45_020989 [Rubus argutus]|uniref:FANCI helical domain-containing protein n=1 Tax=Rubus argutus TaxID=59490 RepID=A0AAW1XBB9_RUBAR